MLLTIDIGNSHAVFGVFREKQLVKTFRVSSREIRDTRGWKIAIQDGLGKELIGSRLGERRCFDAVVVASVVPAVTELMRATWGECFDLLDLSAQDFSGSGNDRMAFYVIDSKSPYSFRIAANPPEKVGVDRLVNAEAAVREYGRSCIVVDAGTATTICAIRYNEHSDQSEFLGGAIIPGLKLGMEALASHTAQLFSVELTPPPRKAIGENTREALQSGIVLGYASMIDGMIQRFKSELGVGSGMKNTTLPVIATGGVSHLLEGVLREVNVFDFDLTLKGMAYLYRSVGECRDGPSLGLSFVRKPESEFVCDPSVCR